ncbi:MAG: replication initiator protein A [Oscillospiraceae bacterium]|nr:replication initiator protein A [Oscillospiraceae bacterium]
MRAAQMKERPGFDLMKQTDIQNLYYMQMPRWLFSDPRYSEMSLEAKVTYTFLLNRFQLSRRKGWVNEDGEVFVIFPRKALAQELRICEKRVIAAFRKLAELHLIWEKRCGRGDANQIYLARVEPMDDPAYECAPFHSESYENDGSRTADLTVLPEEEGQEPQDRQLKNGRTGSSRTAETAVAELPILQSSNKEIRNTDQSQKKVSPSVRASPPGDGRTDDEKELMGILDACELFSFPADTARVFENAIERLYYSDSFRIGNATLPRSRVRSRLRLLDGMILQEAERKLTSNLEREVINSTAYTMATIFNCISESESDLIVDPYLNSLRAPDPVRRC